MKDISKMSDIEFKEFVMNLVRLEISMGIRKEEKK